MSHAFHSLLVSKVVQETDQSSSIYFDIPEHLKDDYQYKSGQYLTLRFTIKDEDVRRAYSICTSPLESDFGVNVKRVDKGLVSNYINDQLKKGDSVDVMTPDGNFGLDQKHELSRDLYFFASGSGITPIISIIKTTLEEEPKSRCYLLYGNKNEDSIIFKDQLESLSKRHEGQFFLTHTLSQPKKEKVGGLKGMFSRGKESWTGLKGRIDGKKIDQYLENHPSLSKENHYFVCGPGAMIDTIIDHLEKKDIDKGCLHTEHFVSNAPAGGGVATGDATESQVKVHVNGKEIDVVVPPEKTILDVLIDEKHDVPYSCTSGACSTCIAKLISGDVSMDACYALDDDEVKDGYILVCQSRANSSVVELTFDT